MDMIFSTFELAAVLKLLLSSVLAAIIGIERRKAEKPVGIRTSIFVASASTLFAIVALEKNIPFLVGSVVAGIGFIGGGLVMKEGNKITGLTTAATIWMLTAIGTSIGMGYYLIALFTTIMSLIVLQLKRLY